MRITDNDRQEYLRQFDRLQLAFTDTMNLVNGVKEATPEFLDMIARHPGYIDDHQRPGALAVPKHLRFNHIQDPTVIKTALLRAEVDFNGDDSDTRVYVSIDYPALAKMFPERAKMSRRDKWMDTHFEQRRCPSAILTYTGIEPLFQYMQTLENTLVYFLARYGADGRKLQRDADGAAVMPRVDEVEARTYLKKVYAKAAAYGSFARYDAQETIPFGVVTRTMLPYFCDLISLHYYKQDPTQRSVTFAFPMLDIGKMRFEMEDGETAHYQRVVKIKDREVVRQDTLTTGEWMRHEMADMLAGPMREMGIISKDFLGEFLSLVDDLRTIIKEGGPFNPRKLSPTHEAFISRLQ